MNKYYLAEVTWVSAKTWIQKTGERKENAELLILFLSSTQLGIYVMAMYMIYEVRLLQE